MTVPNAFQVPPINKRKRVTMKVIRAIAKHIAENYNPEKMVLFGSHACGKPIERTHVLTDLLTLCLPVDKEFRDISKDLNSLDGYAVAVRYPGATVSVELAEEAFRTAGQIRQFVRRKWMLE